MGRISVKNGGPSRSGEKRKTPQTKNSQNRYAGSRQKETEKSTLNRKDANVKLCKEGTGLYICEKCRKVKPKEDFPRHVPTSGKFSRYETCTQCLDGRKARRRASGVTQSCRDRNATRCIHWQRVVKANLKDKPGFEEYEAECDAANPGTIFKIRCTKEEIEEKLLLVQHG